MVQSHEPKGLSKKPLSGKSIQYKESAGAVAVNGKDRHSTGDEFEEF
jgi:hypothetical protein